MILVYRTDDPLADHRRWEAELARLEEQVPWCRDCDKPVMEDFYYEIDEERPICAECLEEKHKVENDGENPVCDYHGKAITDDYYYRNDGGEVFCRSCVDKHFRKEVVIE